MRSTNARTLNGGVTMVASVCRKNVPKRPSDTTMSIAHRPRASKGTRTGDSGRSAMHGAAIDAERPQREVLRVEVVVQHEHAREPRAVPPRVVPRAVRPLRPHEIRDPALDGRRSLAAGREQ